MLAGTQPKHWELRTTRGLIITLPVHSLFYRLMFTDVNFTQIKSDELAIKEKMREWKQLLH